MFVTPSIPPQEIHFDFSQKIEEWVKICKSSKCPLTWGPHLFLAKTGGNLVKWKSLERKCNSSSGTTQKGVYFLKWDGGSTIFNNDLPNTTSIPLQRVAFPFWASHLTIILLLFERNKYGPHIEGTFMEIIPFQLFY